ncbi:protein CIP2A [Aplysia californica]|uniref:Protein CIP2A n=1 Tax=Aplysia californica TaxID=6500 RepID=A0ABM0K608_APLCA|nr:protein CIP2A [Aplysia californica]XP_005109544.1 protein CIP2A [Aplysia californica]XP_012944115.1 protein CIP2A [Aplysia californica]
MEPSSCVREVLRCANHFQSNSGQLTYLLRQLEVLQQYSSRSSHVRQLQSGDQVELVECLTFLVKVVCERERPELLLKAVQILSNLAHSEELRSLLYETFSLSSPLAAVVVAYSGVSEDEILPEALQLLQRITYGHRIDYHQPHMDELLRFLVLNVLSPDLDSLVPPVLGTLANLCRNNVLVHSAIKDTFSSDLRKLLKILCGYFSDDNQTVVISALRIFTSISLNEPEGQKVFFESSNVEQTLQTVFNIIVNKFKTVTWKYAADLLADLMRQPQMQICIKRYRHLPKCMNDVLSLLALGSEDSVSEVFELLLHLCAVPSIRQSVNSRLFSALTEGQMDSKRLSEAAGQALMPGTEPLLSCVHWSAHTGNTNSSVALLALEFLSESLQECTCSSDASYPIHLLAPVFANFLLKAQLADSSAKTVRVVKLLTVLCSDKGSRESLGRAVTCEMFNKLMDSLLSQGYVSYAAATSPFSGSDKEKKDEGTLGILLTLNLASKLQKLIPGVPQYLTKVLKEPRVQDFLALGLTSGSQEQVEVSLQLLAMSLGAEEARPEVALCGFIASLNRQKREQRKVEEAKTEPSSKVQCRRDTVLQSKENRPGPLLSSTPVPRSDRTGLGGMGDKSGDSSVEILIERMQTVLEPKDTKTAQLIEVFEHHIKSQQVKEEHLNNLLEAKTMALTQADRVIVRLRSMEAAHFAEMNKLQGILKESERKVELMIAQMNEMRLEAEKQQTQFDKELDVKIAQEEKFAKEINEISDKCAEVEEKLAACVQEKKTLSNMKEDLQRAHEVLKEQYDKSCTQSKQLEEERKTLSKQLKEKDAAVQKLKSSLQTLQETYSTTEKERSELEKEKEDMETYIDKLRTQLSSSENLCRQLQQRTKTLEGVNEEEGKKLLQKTARIEELEKELEKHNQIVSFIQHMNLKGGKK